MESRLINTVDKLWSIEAEAGVLGSMIQDEKCISWVLPILHEVEMFFKLEHQIIYDALLLLYIAKVPIDGVMLRAELKKINKLEAVGGVGYLRKILDSVPSAANAVYYAGVVREKYQYRQMIRAIEQINTIPNEPIPLSDQVEKIQAIVLDIKIETAKADYVDFGIAPSVVDNIRDHTELVPTGFVRIDHIVQGISPGELVILAGRPSMGKSALMLDVALKMAEKKVGVLIFTLEMAEKALIERAICSLANINLTQAKGNLLVDEKWASLKREAETAKELLIFISSIGTTAEQQISLIRRLKKTHEIGCVFVDYLQLMHTTGKAESRQQAISEISRKLKLAAIREQVPIVALSQLNRMVENRTGHRPRMSDLRESGSIEQDADIVLLLHREDYYRRILNPTCEVDGTTELIVAKNRRGPTGVAKLVFVEEYCKFGDRKFI